MRRTRPLPKITDSHLPRHQRRFPYRAASPAEVEEVRKDIDACVRQVVDMSFLHARRIGARAGWTEDLIEEAAWSALGHYATHVLPRFDARKNTKPSTLAMVSLHRSVIEFARRQQAQQCRQPVVSFDERLGRGRDLGVELSLDRVIRRYAETVPAEDRRAVAKSTLYRHRHLVAERGRAVLADAPIAGI